MIYVTGADGQLGNELKKQLGTKAVYLNRQQLDLSKTTEVENFLDSNKIEMLINAAAYTHVDKAQSEHQLSMTINAEVPRLMARYSLAKKFKLIHFSSDYVFKGSAAEPYREDSQVEPVNFYGVTKLQGEIGILKENSKCLIVRTSWVHSSFGRNFIKTILKLGNEKELLNIVYDQVGTLTWARDLAQVALLARDLNGIYHYSNEGVSSWYDVAFELKRLGKIKSEINPILSAEYPTDAKRPSYSVLNKNKIKNELGIKIPHWTESLSLCLKELS